MFVTTQFVDRYCLQENIGILVPPDESPRPALPPKKQPPPTVTPCPTSDLGAGDLAVVWVLGSQSDCANRLKKGGDYMRNRWQNFGRGAWTHKYRNTGAGQITPVVTDNALRCCVVASACVG